MQNYFVLDTKQTSEVIPMIGAVSKSTGDGLDLVQRYGYDYSDKPQGLVYRKMNTAMTATIQLAFNNSLCLEDGFNIMEYIAKLHDITGKQVEVFWGGKDLGRFVIVSTQYAAEIDVHEIYLSTNVSISLTEAYTKVETLNRAVSGL